MITANSSQTATSGKIAKTKIFSRFRPEIFLSLVPHVRAVPAPVGYSADDGRGLPPLNTLLVRLRLTRLVNVSYSYFATREQRRSSLRCSQFCSQKTVVKQQTKNSACPAFVGLCIILGLARQKIGRPGALSNAKRAAL